MGWPEAIFGCVSVVAMTYFLIKVINMDSVTPPYISPTKPEPLWKITTTTYPSVPDKKEKDTK